MRLFCAGGLYFAHPLVVKYLVINHIENSNFNQIKYYLHFNTNKLLWYKICTLFMYFSTKCQIKEQILIVILLKEY
jgi:hypothetical protein